VNTPAGPPRVGKLYLTYLPTGYTAIPAAPTEHVVCSTRGCQSPSAVPTESTAGSVLLQGTRLPPIAINLGPGPYAPGARPEQVRIHGHPAVLSVDSGSGAIMLSWRYDRDTYAFVGMDGALTAERQAVVLRVAKGLLPHGASAGPTPTNRYCMYATPGTNMDDDACFATQTAVDAYARAVEY
jgi:hypothetical protein